MSLRYLLCLAVGVSLATGAGAVPRHEIELTVVPVLGWGPGFAATYGAAWSEHLEGIAGLGFNGIDLALDFGDADSKSHGFARAQLGMRYYSGNLRGLYLQPEMGFHFNFYELYHYDEPRGFRDETAFSAVPAFLVGGRWVFVDAISARGGLGLGFQVPWDFGNRGTLPVMLRLDICLGYAF